MSKPEYVSAYTDADSNTVVTVSAAQAKADGLTVLKSDPPVGKNGRPRGPREGGRTAAKTSPKPAASNTPTHQGGSAASSNG